MFCKIAQWILGNVNLEFWKEIRDRAQEVICLEVDSNSNRSR